MQGNQFHFQELNGNGDVVRLKRKMKARNLMVFSLNFVDDATLSKVQKVFHQLSPEDLARLKEYLNKKAYMDRAQTYANEHRLIQKVAQIALSSVPSDPELKGIMNKFNHNLEVIDDLKKKTIEVYEADKFREIMTEIDRYNDENMTLFEQVNRFRDRKFARAAAAADEDSEESADE